MADVRLTVLPEAAQVAPGGRLSLSLTVQNTSRLVDRYRLAVAGVPQSWVDLEKPEVSPRSRPFFGQPHPYEIEFRAPEGAGPAVDPFLADVDPALVRQARFTYLPPSAGLTLPPWLRRLPRWAFILLLLLLTLLLFFV